MEGHRYIRNDGGELLAHHRRFLPRPYFFSKRAFYIFRILEYLVQAMILSQ